MTSAASAAASSPATLLTSEPIRASFTSPPSCCAAATASHEARLSLPSLCSATTRIIDSSLYHTVPSVADHPRLVAQLLDQCLRGFGRRAGQHLRLLALLGEMDGDDVLRRARGSRRRDF